MAIQEANVYLCRLAASEQKPIGWWKTPSLLASSLDRSHIQQHTLPPPSQLPATRSSFSVKLIGPIGLC